MIKRISLLLTALLTMLALQPAQAVTVTSVTITGPGRVCLKCPPGGSAWYEVTITGTNLDGDTLIWSVYDSDVASDDILIPETALLAVNADVNGNNWTHTTRFELFCNESTDCEVYGRASNNSGGFNTYSSGEAVAEVYAMVETMAGWDLGESSVLSVACVPEPQTWALMISGFGLVGGALRRRRAVLA